MSDSKVDKFFDSLQAKIDQGWDEEEKANVLDYVKHAANANVFSQHLVVEALMVRMSLRSSAATTVAGFAQTAADSFVIGKASKEEFMEYMSKVWEDREKYIDEVREQEKSKMRDNPWIREMVESGAMTIPTKAEQKIAAAGEELLQKIRESQKEGLIVAVPSNWDKTTN